MQTQRENSTLFALREVRSLEAERRRKEQLRQEEEARRSIAEVEENRRTEQLAREAAMREQTMAMRRSEENLLREKEVLRLRNELSQRENEITRLRKEGETSRQALPSRTAMVAPTPHKVSPIPWVACAVFSVLALAMALGRFKTPQAASPKQPLAMSCPTPAAMSIPLPPTPTIQAPRSPVVEGRQKSHDKTRRRPPPSPAQSISKPQCDGSDPLCGIDVQRLSDEGKKPRGIW